MQSTPATKVNMFCYKLYSLLDVRINLMSTFTVVWWWESKQSLLFVSPRLTEDLMSSRYAVTVS